MHQSPRLLKQGLKTKFHSGDLPTTITMASYTPSHNLGLHRHLVVILGRAPNGMSLPPFTKGNCVQSTYSAWGRSLVWGGNRPPGSLWREWR